MNDKPKRGQRQRDSADDARRAMSDQRTFQELIEQSSLGTRGARALRRRISESRVRRVRPLADEQTQPTAQHGLAHAVHAELDALIDGVPVAALADVLGVDERQVEHAIRAVSLSVLADLWRTAENDEAGAAAIAAGARRHARRKPGDCAGGEEDDAEQFGAVLPIVADYPEKGLAWDGTQGGIDNDPRIRQLVMLVAQLSLVHLGNVVEDLVAAGYTPSNAVRFSLRTMLAGPPPRW